MLNKYSKCNSELENNVYCREEKKTVRRINFRRVYMDSFRLPAAFFDQS